MVSEATPIPGNQHLAAAEVAHRQDAYFRPFQDRVAQLLDARVAAGQPTVIIGVHSFTPVFHGVRRTLHAGILYARAVDLGSRLLAQLRSDSDLRVGDNEPYRIEPEHDHTVPIHGDARGLPAALIEVRQDLLADPAGIESWARRLATAITAALA